MPRTCIIVADGARARFLTVAVPVEPAMEGGPRLVEHDVLVNPAGDVPERAVFSDRRGSAHASPSGAAHALDDHRGQHRHEQQRRYAQRIATLLQRFVADERATQLLIVAEPRLLGALRGAIDAAAFSGVAVTEIAENLSRQSLDRIQSVLASRGAVPAARAPSGAVFRPAGQHPAG